MKIELTTPPVKRTFALHLDADELVVLHNALLEDNSEVRRGAAKNYDLYCAVTAVLEEHGIEPSVDDR